LASEKKTYEKNLVLLQFGKENVIIFFVIVEKYFDKFSEFFSEPNKNKHVPIVHMYNTVYLKKFSYVCRICGWISICGSVQDFCSVLSAKKAGKDDM
jgi:hypothetical protein